MLTFEDVQLELGAANLVGCAKEEYLPATLECSTESREAYKRSYLRLSCFFLPTEIDILNLPPL